VNQHDLNQERDNQLERAQQKAKKNQNVKRIWFLIICAGIISLPFLLGINWLIEWLT